MWIAAGCIIGLVISAAIWHTVSTQLRAFIIEANPFQNQSAIAAIVQDSIHNPEVQQILHSQIMLYLKSPEGKAKLAEMMKSPEMVKAMAENLRSPELRPALIQLLHEPDFRDPLMLLIREAPEMRVLRVLDSAIEWNIPPDNSNSFQ